MKDISRWDGCSVARFNVRIQPRPLVGLGCDALGALVTSWQTTSASFPYQTYAIRNIMR